MADSPRKDGFNTSAKKDAKSKTPNRSTPLKEYTHDDVMGKTQNMITAARTPEQRKVIHDIQQGYEAIQARKDQSRIDRNAKFAMGLRAGIHPGKSYDDLLRDDHKRDQIDRNQVMKEAKDYYHQNYSLRKSFRSRMRKDQLKSKAKDAMNKANNKGKEIDKGE